MRHGTRPIPRDLDQGLGSRHPDAEQQHAQRKAPRGYWPPAELAPMPDARPTAISEPIDWDRSITRLGAWVEERPHATGRSLPDNYLRTR